MMIASDGAGQRNEEKVEVRSKIRKFFTFDHSIIPLQPRESLFNE
jgi:hypothetical protein